MNLTLALLPWALAAGQGLPPRSSPNDYPVHQRTLNATIAAVRMRPDQVTKTFSSEIDKNYVVVEVALYPQDGASIDVDLFDFGLRFGGEQETRPATPEEASVPWREKDSIGQRVTVTEQAGVYVAAQKDQTGRRTTTGGAYEATGVAVGGPQGQPYPDPHRGPDPRALEDRLKARSLPEGKTGRAVAGYLCFPRPKKSKDSKLELTYSQDTTAIALVLPAK
jgi:hypothetical protein